MRIFLLCCFLMLTACAAPQNTGDAKAAEPPPQASLDEKSADKVPGEVDYSCKTASDCKIKDVGSCCGHRPACVNKDSQTFPEEVKAQCGKSGMAGICGFPSISGCTCTDNKCEGVAGPMSEEKIQ